MPDYELNDEIDKVSDEIDSILDELQSSEKKDSKPEVLQEKSNNPKVSFISKLKGSILRKEKSVVKTKNELNGQTLNYHSKFNDPKETLSSSPNLTQQKTIVEKENMKETKTNEHQDHQFIKNNLGSLSFYTASKENPEEKKHKEEEKETEKAKPIKKSLENLCKVDEIIEKYKGEPEFENLATLETEGTLMDFQDILNNLDIDKSIFESKMAKNPIEFILYYRQKLEAGTTYLYDTLQDLEVDGNIGQFGQRLPNLFSKVKTNYSSEELPSDIRELVDAEKDINKLISATVQLSLKMWAAHDMSLYILISLSKKRDKLISQINNSQNELMQLEENKEQIRKEIEEENEKFEKIKAEHVEKTKNLLLENSTLQKEEVLEDEIENEEPLNNEEADKDNVEEFATNDIPEESLTEEDSQEDNEGSVPENEEHNDDSDSYSKLLKG
jgi:hypothetical protein